MTVPTAAQQQDAARVDVAVSELQRRLEQDLEQLADAATAAIFSEMPAYAVAPAALHADVTAHVLAHYRALARSFRERRAITAEDLLFVGRYTATRVRQVPIADYIHAFQTGQRVLWEAALSFAHDDRSRMAVLELASYLPRYFEVATSLAAEVYLEAEQELAATGERARRDLLDDLFAGRPVPPGPEREAAYAAGLLAGKAYLVVVATPTSTPVGDHELRGAAAALARAAGGAALAPLTVLRRNEIVIVAVAPDDDPSPFEACLGAAQQRLAEGQLPLAVGVSTVVTKLDELQQAYREAELARASLGSSSGFVALGNLTALAYLTLAVDTTAQRLIAPAIRRFIAEDAREGGPLIATLRAYVAADLNASLAAERLHIHVNTAHYRLGRISARTGCNLRAVPDLVEILIAARFAEVQTRDRPGP